MRERKLEPSDEARAAAERSASAGAGFQYPLGATVWVPRGGIPLGRLIVDYRSVNRWYTDSPNSGPTLPAQEEEEEVEEVD